MFRRMSLFLMGLVVVSTCCLPGAYAWELLVSNGTGGTVERFSDAGVDLGALISGGPTVQHAYDIAYGYYGDLFVLDYLGQALRRYDHSTGAYKDTIATGIKDAGGIASDVSGDVFVSHRATGTDWGVVTRFDPRAPNTGRVVVPAGTNGLFSPADIEVGPDGNLYVLAQDSWNANVSSIFVFSPDGAFVKKRATGTSYVSGLAFNGGYMYWSDYYGGQVYRLSLAQFQSGTPAAFLSGYADAMVTVGIEFGPDGKLYVASTSNDRVVRFNGTTGVYDTEFAYGPSPHPYFMLFTGQSFPTRPPDQDVLVSTGRVASVERYTKYGVHLGKFTSGGPTLQWASDISLGYYDDLFVLDFSAGAVYCYDDQTGVYKSTIASGLNQPTGIAFDAGDYMYVVYRHSDGTIGIVNRYDLQNPGSGIVFLPLGAADYLIETGDIEVGPDGNIYILGKDGEIPAQGNVPSIFVFAPDGTFLLKRHIGNDYAGASLTFGNGYLYWSVFWGGLVMRLPLNDIANGTAQSFLTGYGDPMWCRGLTFGPDASLYVASTYNHRVLRFNGATGAYQTEFIYRPNVSGDYWDPSSIVFNGLGFPARPEPARTIADVKTAEPGSKVELRDAIVTAAWTDDSFQPIAFAIEDEDRFNGVRVISNTATIAGDRMSIDGQVAIVNGERVVSATTATVTSSPGTYPAPVGINNRNSGGGTFGKQGAVVDDATASPASMSTATNSIGILQTIFGKVTSSYYTAQVIDSYYYVDDGSGLKDGSGNVGIKCRADIIAGVPAVDQWVSVTGVMGVQQINGINARFFWSSVMPKSH